MKSNEENQHKLKFTKFLDVKSPKPTPTNNTYVSVGIDLFMPSVSQKLIDYILKHNNDLSVKNENDDNIEFLSKFDKLVMSINTFNRVYTIYDNITIPTGIGILIPAGYHVNLRSKSSNFNNGFTIVEGLIDCNYTYGMGMQIIPFSKEIRLTETQKICQLEMLKSNYITSFDELSQIEWENNAEVIEKRTIRTGGFGITGKF